MATSHDVVTCLTAKSTLGRHFSKGLGGFGEGIKF
jgi:hypothetical protein